MKRYISLLCVLIMMFVTGCQKNTALTESVQTVKTSVVDFDGIPLSESLASSTHLLYDSVDDYVSGFNLSNHIVFKGIKKKDSTQFLSIENGSILYDWRSETPIEVIEPYYGDIKTGDEIIFDEFAAVVEINGESFVVCDESTPPVKKDTEYLFFLSHTGKYSSENKPMYSYIAMYHSIHELSDDIKAAASAETLDKSSFSKDVIRKYYYEKDKLDLRIDLDKELEKLIKVKADTLVNEMEKTTDSKETSKLEAVKDKYTANLKKLEENSIDVNTVIAELEDEDKALVERMKTQYGYK